jgi:hypothetical protein
MWIYYIVQKIINKGMPKVIMQKCLFTFSMWKQPWWSYFDIMNGIQSPLYGHIHNQGTQKDNLTKKDYKGLFLDFYYIYYFMIIVDRYMTIIKMMSC